MDAKQFLTVACALCGSVGAMAGQDATPQPYPIAGTAPWQRPIGAPVMGSFIKDAHWYQQALHGTTRPYPPSFRFLEDQGAWHTPFNRPGMTAPYDLRGWHTE